MNVSHVIDLYGLFSNIFVEVDGYFEIASLIYFSARVHSCMRGYFPIRYIVTGMLILSRVSCSQDTTLDGRSFPRAWVAEPRIGQNACLYPKAWPQGLISLKSISQFIGWTSKHLHITLEMNLMKKKRSLDRGTTRSNCNFITPNTNLMLIDVLLFTQNLMIDAPSNCFLIVITQNLVKSLLSIQIF